MDTNPLVIKTLHMVSSFAESIGHTFVMGYYGDIKQNIYESGIGSRFKKYSSTLNRIEKVFNRRCSPKIISIANRIRNDGLEQESIYENFPKGEVSFYNLNVERKEIVESFIKKWKISGKNQLHCFELTNEYVAMQSGFQQIYDFFKNSKWYKTGRNYEFLRDHLLSLEQNKLGPVQKLLFRILDFRYKINCDSTMLLDIFSKQSMNDVNILELREIIEKLQNIHGNTLEEYLINLFDKSIREQEKINRSIEYVVAENIKSYAEMKKFILDQLYYFSEAEEMPEDDIIENEQKVIEFFQIDMSIFERWYKFVTDSYEGKVIYHTYHSTKGREFDNVIIFMNSKFGKRGEFFGNLLKVLNEKNENSEIGTEIEEARNLLYVAVTRAIQNLCIVYFDDIDEIRDNVVSVFGEIKTKIE